MSLEHEHGRAYCPPNLDLHTSVRYFHAASHSAVVNFVSLTKSCEYWISFAKTNFSRSSLMLELSLMTCGVRLSIVRSFGEVFGVAIVEGAQVGCSVTYLPSIET